ncbi:hypothetical protein [Streptomyces hoynatensis]|uniref:Uncharacterized protein n=1 Tax=Streptomyces hoynatensis TaxID=1141874 RepID=A0A3A9Z422_9ACTN|nr:hypothetical protein [Streptomyces hoynatensis]RKN43025.1 hypothetical protein D7294_10960 [Streptomyces hoynatensis]
MTGEPEPEPEPGEDGPRQHVGQGTAVLGDVKGDVNVHIAAAAQDAAAEKVVKPRFREGPYPEEDVAKRLRAFVEPPSFARAREVLARRRVLLLVGAAGTGAGTAAFALLRELPGETGRLIGLDPRDDPTGLEPKGKGRRYLVPWLSQDSAEALTEVALTALQDRLERAGAHLVVVAAPTLRLPAGTARWQIRHEPPLPAEVARAHLRTLGLSEDHLSLAAAHLGDPQVKAYLDGTRDPAAGTEVAEELKHVALGSRTLHEALLNLTRTAEDEATETLREARKDPAALALATSIALLEGQDRTVIARCAAALRPLLDPTPPEPPPAGPKGLAKAEPDVLGDDFTTRLDRVNADPLPRVVDSGSRYWYRYWVEPIAFRRRHQAETILSRLWLDHEGIAEAILHWLRKASTRYAPGLDYTAGQAIGRVLRRATGPDVLQRLEPLAESPERWRRRLVAYALNEAARDGLLAGAVRDQLWTWSRARNEHLRATVAETCAGGFGLVRPDRTLRMLDRLLDGPARSVVRRGVSLAIAVLLTEGQNAAAVTETLTRWMARPEKSGQRDYALGAAPQLLSDFLALDAGEPGPLLPLVRESLDDPKARSAVMDALLRAERSPHPGTRARATALVTALAATAGGRRGVRALLVARLRNQAGNGKLTEGNLA